MTKLRLEAVECFERDVKLRLPFRFGVITVTRVDAGGDPRHGRARGRAHQRRRRRRDTERQVVRQEPGVHRRAEPRPAAPVARALRSTSIARRGGARPSASTPAPIAAQLARGADLGLVPLVASYGPALLDRAILDALGRAVGLSFAEMIRRNVAGIGATRAHARSRGLRPARLPWRPEGRSRHRRAPHRGPGRSDCRRRPEAGRARQRRPAGDAGGGRPPLSRPLLQAEGWRRHRGRPRAAEAHRRRARRTPATTARRSTATSSTTTSRASPSCGGACARRRRSTRLVAATLFIEQPIKRAAALKKPVDAAGAAEAAHHR